MSGNDLWLYKNAGRTGTKLSEVHYYLDKNSAPPCKKLIIWFKKKLGYYKKFDIVKK